MARSVQADVRTAGRDVPVQLVSTLEAAIRRSLAPRVFSLVLLACFAALALLLAAAGLYGVISYAVARRAREIGIRMALGAGKPDVLRAVFGQEARWIAAGLVIGVLGSSVIARLLRSMLFGVQPGDLLTFLGVIAVLTIVSAVACCVPAVRATRVDPVTALRED
jgi:ABC-type antimicrobial peptide transport system permease subunit